MLLIAAVPASLIMLQPDLGTMLVLSATVFGVLAATGAPRRWLVMLAAGGVAAGVAAVVGGLLEDYQVDRFLAFTDPTLDPRGAGYNVEQARIAVGNGGLFGQGLFNGSQTRSGFVPEQHTDFVFTVAGEELGLVGAGVVIALLGVVLWRALRIAARTDDVFGRVAAAGIACWFGFQAFQNIGMCLGIMPVTGVPLPFVSYGGSSMFAWMLAVGLLLNIRVVPPRPPAARLQPANGCWCGPRTVNTMARWRDADGQGAAAQGCRPACCGRDRRGHRLLALGHVWAGGRCPSPLAGRDGRRPGFRRGLLVLGAASGRCSPPRRCSPPSCSCTLDDRAGAGPSGGARDHPHASSTRPCSPRTPPARL